MSTRQARRRALALVLGAALLPGCASSGEERVEVHLANVVLLDAMPLEQRMRLTLRFQNRGNADLTVDGLAYRIEASGTTVASGVSSQIFTVPRFGEARVEVEATSTLAGIVRDVYELQQKSGVQHPRLRYRIHGTASLVAPPLALGRSSSFGFDTVNELPLATEATEPPARAR